MNVATILTLFQLASAAVLEAERLIAESKAAGDPVPQEIVDAQARANDANARIHALVNG